MSNRLSDERLLELHVEIAGRARRMKDSPLPAMMSVDAKEIARALDELRQRRGMRGAQQSQLHAITRQLMAMKVGQSIWLTPAVSNSRLTTYRRSARNAMRNQDARWHTLISSDHKHTMVVRKPDGAKHEYGLPRSNLPGQLSLMKIGEKIVVEMKGRLPNAMKIKARELVEKDDAQWRTESLANGKTRITRTA